jgi:glycosyltransferase involved in cell wall biosynthesis
MKICFISSARYTKPLDSTLEKKFQLLNSIGQIYTIGFSNDMKTRFFEQGARFYLMPLVPIPIVRYLLFFCFGPVISLWCVLHHGVDVLVAQSPYEGFAAAWAKILARLIGKSVALVVESHGNFETDLFLQRHISRPSLYRLLMRNTARFTFRFADALRAISASTQKQLETWVPEKPITKFPTWTDIDVFLEESEATLQGHGEKIVLYVGILAPRKGIHFLIKAFSKIAGSNPAAKLWLIGNVEDQEYAESIVNQTRRQELEGRVTFYDAMPQRQLASYITKACVLVLPSLSEGLGRVVFEAMACGTPVIASRVGGIPDMIVDGETGFLIPPGDITSLTSRLLWILTHHKEAMDMGQRARRFARDFFSQEVYAQSYARLFEQATRVVQTRG